MIRVNATGLFPDKVAVMDRNCLPAVSAELRGTVQAGGTKFRIVRPAERLASVERALVALLLVKEVVEPVAGVEVVMAVHRIVFVRAGAIPVHATRQMAHAGTVMW